MLDTDFRRDLRSDRDALESTLMGSAHPSVPESQLLAADWQRKWAEAAAAAPLKYRPWSAHHWFWKRLNHLDGIPRTT